ncbi:MAG: hypothetical protein WBA12_12335 [Catalinimonas sp.]
MNLIHFIFDIYLQASEQRAELSRKLTRRPRHSRTQRIKMQQQLATYDAVVEQSYYIFRSLEVIRETSLQAINETFYDVYLDDALPVPDPHELILNILSCDEILNITHIPTELRVYIEEYPSLCLSEKVKAGEAGGDNPYHQYLDRLEQSFIVHSYDLLTERIRDIAADQGNLGEVIDIIEYGRSAA